MSSERICQEGDCPTFGVETVRLERFADVGTDDGERIVYDAEEEDAWIQADLYFPRESVR